MRYLVLHLPAFRLERCGYAADELACLVAERKNATRLVALTPAAREAGLCEGMTAAEARSLQPEVELFPLDEHAEQADRAALVRRFGQLSDRVAAPWWDHLVLEVTHTSKLFGGEGSIVARARELASSLGHACRLVLADDPLGAAALSVRVAADEVVPRGALGERLADLPLRALCVPDRALASLKVVDALRIVGIERIGQLARLDAASVAGRYGEAGVRLHRLARGLPTTGGELGWGSADGDLPRTAARLAGATTTLQLHFVLPGLLAELSDRLAAQDLAAVRLRLVLRLDQRDQAPAVLGVGVGRPTRNAALLERLIRARLEGLRVESPVEELILEVVEAIPEQGWQPGLTDRTEAVEPLPDVLARLRDHLGPDALVRPRLADAWRPEAAWRQLEVGQGLPREPVLPLVGGESSDDPVEVQQAWELRLGAPRPTLLLPEPTLVEVQLQSGRPARLRLEGTTHRITRCEGPERLEGDWWSPATHFDRAYWVLEVDGRTAWVFQERGRWFLHGWFD